MSESVKLTMEFDSVEDMVKAVLPKRDDKAEGAPAEGSFGKWWDAGYAEGLEDGERRGRSGAADAATYKDQGYTILSGGRKRGLRVNSNFIHSPKATSPVLIIEDPDTDSQTVYSYKEAVILGQSTFVSTVAEKTKNVCGRLTKYGEGTVYIETEAAIAVK